MANRDAACSPRRPDGRQALLQPGDYGLTIELEGEVVQRTAWLETPAQRRHALETQRCRIDSVASMPGVLRKTTGKHTVRSRVECGLDVERKDRKARRGAARTFVPIGVVPSASSSEENTLRASRRCRPSRRRCPRPRAHPRGERAEIADAVEGVVLRHTTLLMERTWNAPPVGTARASASAI